MAGEKLSAGVLGREESDRPPKVAVGDAGGEKLWAVLRGARRGRRDAQAGRWGRGRREHGHWRLLLRRRGKSSWVHRQSRLHARAMSVAARRCIGAGVVGSSGPAHHASAGHSPTQGEHTEAAGRSTGAETGRERYTHLGQGGPCAEAGAAKAGRSRRAGAGARPRQSNVHAAALRAYLARTSGAKGDAAGVGFGQAHWLVSACAGSSWRPAAGDGSAAMGAGRAGSQ